MQQQYNNQYQQGQPQYQQAPQQPYQQPYYQAPKAPMSKKQIFGLIVTICFGVAAIFALIAMIGFCVKLRADAGMIISYIIITLACIGIAIAPFLKAYSKLVICLSGCALFLGYYGFSISSLAGSFGFFVLILGYACLAILCWLGYTNNNLVKIFAFIPGSVIFVGALINWIVIKYFTMMKYAVVFYLFDFLTTLVLIGGSVLLGLYLIEMLGVQSKTLRIPNPAPRAPRAPQQPQYQPQYQQAPQQPQYQAPQQPQQPQQPYQGQ